MTQIYDEIKPNKLAAYLYLLFLSYSLFTLSHNDPKNGLPLGIGSVFYLCSFILIGRMC